MERTSKQVDVLLTEQLRLSSPGSNSKTASLRPLPQPKRIGDPLPTQQRATTKVITRNKPQRTMAKDVNETTRNRPLQTRRRQGTKAKRLPQRKRADSRRDPPSRKPRPAWNEDYKPAQAFDDYSKDTAKRLHYTNATRTKKRQSKSKGASARSKIQHSRGMTRRSLGTRQGELRRRRGNVISSDKSSSVRPRAASDAFVNKAGVEEGSSKAEETSSERIVDKENCVPSVAVTTRSSSAQTASVMLCAPQPEMLVPVDADSLRKDRASAVDRRASRREVDSATEVERLVQRVLEKERDGFIRAAHQVYSREMAYSHRREESKLGEELESLIRLEDEILAKWDSALQEDEHEEETHGHQDSSPCDLARVIPKRQADFSRIDVVGNDPVRSILGGRRRFLHHRQMVEASLHGTGMSQWQIVESISDILVEELVTAASNEVCKICDEIADHLVRSV